MTGVTQTGPAWLCSTRWPWLGGKRPIKTGHTLFIINMVESIFQDECQRNSLFVGVRTCFWHLKISGGQATRSYSHCRYIRQMTHRITLQKYSHRLSWELACMCVSWPALSWKRSFSLVKWRLIEMFFWTHVHVFVFSKGTVAYTLTLHPPKAFI